MMFSKDISAIIFRYGENGLTVQAVANENFKDVKEIRFSTEEIIHAAENCIKEEFSVATALYKFMDNNLREDCPLKAFLCNCLLAKIEQSGGYV